MPSQAVPGFLLVKMSKQKRHKSIHRIIALVVAEIFCLTSTAPSFALSRSHLRPLSVSQQGALQEDLVQELKQDRAQDGAHKNIYKMTKPQFFLEHSANGYVRPGFFGANRPRIVEKLNHWFGKDGWEIKYLVGGEVISDEEALQLYEDAYYTHFKAHPEELETLLEMASNVYDTSETNVESGADYAVQETEGRHLHDIAIRRVVQKLGKTFRGDQLVRIRGPKTEGFRYGPGKIPFHKPELVPQPALKGWWDAGSIEEFWQSSRVIRLAPGHEAQALLSLRREEGSEVITTFVRLLPFLSQRGDEEFSLEELSDLFWAFQPEDLPKDASGRPRPFTEDEITSLMSYLLNFSHDFDFIRSNLKRTLRGSHQWYRSFIGNPKEKTKQGKKDRELVIQHVSTVPILYDAIREANAVPIFLARDGLTVHEFSRYVTLLEGKEVEGHILYQPGTPTLKSASWRETDRDLDRSAFLVAQAAVEARDRLIIDQVITPDVMEGNIKDPSVFEVYAEEFRKRIEALMRQEGIFLTYSQSLYRQFKAMNIPPGSKVMIVDTNATGKTALYVKTLIELFSEREGRPYEVEVLLGYARDPALNMPAVFFAESPSVEQQQFQDLHWPFFFNRLDERKLPKFSVRTSISKLMLLTYQSMLLYNAAVQYTSESRSADGGKKGIAEHDPSRRWGQTLSRRNFLKLFGGGAAVTLATMIFGPRLLQWLESFSRLSPEDALTQLQSIQARIEAASDQKEKIRIFLGEALPLFGRASNETVLLRRSGDPEKRKQTVMTDVFQSTLLQTAGLLNASLRKGLEDILQIRETLIAENRWEDAPSSRHAGVIEALKKMNEGYLINEGFYVDIFVTRNTVVPEGAWFAFGTHIINHRRAHLGTERTLNVIDLVPLHPETPMYLLGALANDETLLLAPKNLREQTVQRTLPILQGKTPRRYLGLREGFVEGLRQLTRKDFTASETEATLYQKIEEDVILHEMFHAIVNRLSKQHPELESEDSPLSEIPAYLGQLAIGEMPHAGLAGLADFFPYGEQAGPEGVQAVQWVFQQLIEKSEAKGLIAQFYEGDHAHAETSAVQWLSFMDQPDGHSPQGHTLLAFLATLDRGTLQSLVVDIMRDRYGEKLTHQILEEARTLRLEQLERYANREGAQDGGGKLAEWPELAYHKSRLKTGGLTTKLVALTAIQKGLISRPDVPREETILLLTAMLASATQPVLRARILNTLIQLGPEREDVIALFDEALASPETPPLALQEALMAFSDAIYRGSIGTLPPNTVQRIKKLLSHPEDEVAYNALYAFVVAFGGPTHRGGVRTAFLNPEDFRNDQDFVERIQHLTESPELATAYFSGEVLAQLGIAHEAPASPLGGYFDFLESHALKGAEVPIILEEAEMSMLRQLIQDHGERPRHYIVRFFEEGKRVIFIADRTRNAKSLPHLAEDIAWLAKNDQNGPTHVALPLPPSQRENLKAFAKGELQAQDWQYAVTHFWKDVDGIFHPEYAEAFQEALQHLNGILLVLYGKEAQEGEIALQAQVEPIRETLRDSNARVVVLGLSEMGAQLAKTNLHTPHHEIVLSLSQDLNADEVTSLLHIDEEQLFWDQMDSLHNLSEFFGAYAARRSFGLAVHGTRMGTLRFSRFYQESYAEAWDGILFREPDADDTAKEWVWSSIQLGGDRKGGEATVDFNDEAWIEAGRHAYRVWRQDDAILFQRYGLGRNTPLGGVHALALDGSLVAGRILGNYILSSDTHLSGIHFSLTISKNPKGYYSLTLTDHYSRGGTKLAWKRALHARDGGRKIESVFSDEDARRLRQPFLHVMGDLDDSFMLGRPAPGKKALETETRSLIHVLRGFGVGISGITGRSLESTLTRFTSELDPHDRAGQFLAVSGGGRGYRFDAQGNLDPNAPEWVIPLFTEDAPIERLRILVDETVMEALIGLGLGVNDFVPARFEEGNPWPPVKITVELDQVTQTIRNEVARRMNEKLTDKPEYAGITAYASSLAVELFRANKLHAAQEILKRLGIDPRLVLLIGDSENDGPLFQAIPEATKYLVGDPFPGLPPDTILSPLPLTEGTRAGLSLVADAHRTLRAGDGGKKLIYPLVALTAMSVLLSLKEYEGSSAPPSRSSLVTAEPDKTAVVMTSSPTRLPPASQIAPSQIRSAVPDAVQSYETLYAKRQAILGFSRTLLNQEDPALDALETRWPGTKEAFHFLMHVFQAGPLHSAMNLERSVIQVAGEQGADGELSVVEVRVNGPTFEALLEASQQDPRFAILVKSLWVKETGSAEELVLKREHLNTIREKQDAYFKARPKSPLRERLSDPKVLWLARALFKDLVESEYRGYVKWYQYLADRGIDAQAIDAMKQKTQSHDLRVLLNTYRHHLDQIVQNGRVDERRLKINTAMTLLYVTQKGYLPEMRQIVWDVLQEEISEGRMNKEDIEAYWREELSFGDMHPHFLGFLYDPSFDILPRSYDGGRKLAPLLPTFQENLAPQPLSPLPSPLQNFASRAQDGGGKSLAVERTERIREQLIAYLKTKFREDDAAAERRFQSILDLTDFGEIVEEADLLETDGSSSEPQSHLGRVVQAVEKEFRVDRKLLALSKIILRTFLRAESQKRVAKGLDPLVPYEEDLMRHAISDLPTGKVIMMSPALLNGLPEEEVAYLLQDPKLRISFLPTKDRRLQEILKNRIVHPRDIIEALRSNGFVLFVDEEGYEEWSGGAEGSIFGPTHENLASHIVIKISRNDIYGMYHIGEKLLSQAVWLNPQNLRPEDRFLLQTLTTHIEDFPPLPNLARELDYIEKVLVDILKRQV